MNTHRPLFETARAGRSRRLKQRRENRKEIIAQNDPRILRRDHIRRTLIALNREARALDRELKNCRFLPAQCQHCGATWPPTLTPKIRCPKCKAPDWLAIPQSYAKVASNPLDLDADALETPAMVNLGTLDPPPRVDDTPYEINMDRVRMSATTDVDAPPTPATLEEEIEAAWAANNRPRSTADDIVDPLSQPLHEALKLPGRSPEDIKADWDREVAADRTRVTTTLIEDPTLAPSETDEGADYYLNLRILTSKGLNA